MLKYLQLLLSKFVKKSDKEFIGHQAYPSSNKIELTIPSKADLSNYGSFIKTYAPFDGYATLSSSPSYQKAHDIGIMVDKVESKLVSTATSVYLYVPISKGSLVDFYCTTAVENPDILSYLRAGFVKNNGNV